MAKPELQHNMLRVGQGYDMHRLIEEEPLYIGGEVIPFHLGPDAHSDGDVLIHALIDALLGATGLGDIGDHFPDNDENYKDVSGTWMLEQVLHLLDKKNVFIINVDSTIFAEAPKLSPHKLKIRNSVAKLLGLSVDRVSLKAKTAEKFAPIGTSEAIAASVTVLVQMPPLD